MSEKNTSQLYSGLGRGKQAKIPTVVLRENENVVVHVPEGFLATLQTEDFRKYTVTLHKIR